MQGYIKLWRKSLQSPVWDNPNLWRFWTWCLMKASHQLRIAKVGYMDVPLEAGQFIFGRRIASKETGLSEQVVRTCLLSLKNMGNLTSQSTNHFTIISISKWEQYQVKTTNHLTSNQPTTNQQLTTDKNGKNGKNGKNKGTTYAHFGLFWEAYPRKKSKGQAEKVFAKINPDEQLLATMLATIERAKKSDDWLKEGGQYIPYPATWLNAKGWEDEISEVKSGTVRKNPRPGAPGYKYEDPD